MNVRAGLTIALLSLLIFATALGVIITKHQARQLFMVLQEQQGTMESLQVEWSQLLLEQGTWASDSRVERYSREKLRMTLPQPHQVVVVTE